MGVGDRHSAPVSRPQLYEWRRIIVYRCTLRADRKAMGRQPLARGRRRLCRTTCVGIKHLVVGGGSLPRSSREFEFGADQHTHPRLIRRLFQICHRRLIHRSRVEKQTCVIIFTDWRVAYRPAIPGVCHSGLSN